MNERLATAPAPIANTAERIVFLDYLRIFAFTSVVIGHTYYGYAEAYIQDQTHLYLLRSILTLLLPVFYSGGAGVVVFFLVSGYIITHVLQTERTGAFIVKRIFRIYPLYMFAVLLSKIMDTAYKGNFDFHLIAQAFAQHPVEAMHYLQEIFIQLFFQLLLLGDFYNVSDTLGGVEWSLRLEIIFYTYMAILHSLNLFQLHRKILPYILGTTIAILAIAPPFPYRYFYTTGALNIYAPFFLLGAIFYLTTTGWASRFYLLISIMLVVYQYNTAIATYQPRWIGTSFAMLALLIFTVTWILRKYMARTWPVIFLSELTYATYLFHAWLYGYIESFITKHSLLPNYVGIQALLILLVICALTVRVIEKPAVRFGNRLIQKHL